MTIYRSISGQVEACLVDGTLFTRKYIFRGGGDKDERGPWQRRDGWTMAHSKRQQQRVDHPVSTAHWTCIMHCLLGRQDRECMYRVEPLSTRLMAERDALDKRITEAIAAEAADVPGGGK